jgi:hypothetical protein
MPTTKKAATTSAAPVIDPALAPFILGLVSRMTQVVSDNWAKITELGLKPDDLVIGVPGTLPAALAREAIDARWQIMEKVERVEVIDAEQALEQLADIPAATAYDEILAELKEAYRGQELIDMAARALAGAPANKPLNFVKKAIKDQAAAMPADEALVLVAKTFFDYVPAETPTTTPTTPTAPRKSVVKERTPKTPTIPTEATANEFANRQKERIEGLYKSVLGITSTVATVKKGAYTYDVWKSIHNKIDDFEREAVALREILYPANKSMFTETQAALAALVASFEGMKVPEESRLLTDLTKEEYVGPFSKVDWEHEGIWWELFNSGADEDANAVAYDRKMNLLATKAFWYTKEDDAIRLFANSTEEDFDYMADQLEITFSRRDRTNADKAAKVVTVLRETE